MPDVQSHGYVLKCQTAVRNVHPSVTPGNRDTLPLESPICLSPQWSPVRASSVLVVIDANIPNAEVLARGAIAGVEILQLEADQDGICQITAALHQRSQIAALHIVSHGSPGCLYLGNTRLSQETLPLYAPQIRQWSHALTDSASVLLYGCSVAAEPQQWSLFSQSTPFLRALHQLIGRAIAASSTPIGNATLGGNWELDVVLPQHPTPSPQPPFTPKTLATYRGILAAFTVTNTNNSGAGSLRQAMLDANANAGADAIVFNIPGAGPHTISPLTNLPDITESVVIDATTQPGYAGTPLIQLNGSLNGSAVDIAFNLRPGSDGSAVKGFVINNFDFRVFFVESDSNTFQGNYIGTDITGTVDQGNGGGFNISGSNNIIGGVGTNEGNLISGNNFGISIVGNNNTIQGNLIGTDVTGVAALGNLGEGISFGFSTGNQIGGTTAAARNVIAGNGDYGISFITGSDNNFIQGNYIGVGSDGTTALGNGGSGIYIQESSGNLIGGTAAGARNVISSNVGAGIEVWGPASTSDNNIIQGNFIGTNAAGTADLGNTAEGVWLREGANGNTIGETTTTARNIISGNNTNGITIDGGTGNNVLGNSIFNNGQLGIDLGNNGVTANDAGDGDTGANNLQNFPVLTTATVLGGTTTITGILNTGSNISVRIEFFSNDTADGSGNGEGQTFLTAITTITDDSGNYTINQAIAQDLTGKFITATVTRITTGDTSEFSGAIEALAGGDPLVVINANDSGAGSLRNAIAFANSNSGADTITFDTSLGSPFADATPDTILLTSGGFNIIDSVTITGLGANLLTIQRDGGASDFRLFTIDDGTASQITVDISGFTLTGGNVVSDSGGAIFNRENLTVSNSILQNNTASFGGGAIDNQGILIVENSAISDNTSLFGGAISNQGSEDATTTISNSTLSNNQASDDGGAIYNDSGTINIESSTVSNNISGLNGGAIFNRFGDVTVLDSTLANNQTLTSSGGAIYNEFSNLTVTNSTLSANVASDQGGAIWSDNSAINIQASQISNNTADGSGGGIFSNRGSLSILTSTISGNTGTFTSGDGGGVWHFGDGLGEDLTITASTISGNSTNGFGGGIWTSTVLGATSATILSSTISGNTAADGSGGLQNDNGLTTISNSTITNNTAPNNQGSGVGSFSDISSTRTEVISSIIAGNVNSDIDILFGSNSSFVSNGNNLIGTGEAAAIASFNQATDITGVTNPGLNPLANNGGPTQTHSLTDTSLARDAGNANGLTRDQRGFPRVIDSSADIGAFEADEVVDPLIVTNTNDSGAGSLRAAIDFANSNPGADSITFNIPTSDPGYNSGTGAYTINLLSELPFITETISIDGSSQPGFAGTPIIELNGATIGGSSFGGILSLGGGVDNSVIRGLVINNTPALAIQVSGGDGVVIAGNYIGTDVTGTVAQNTSSFGILLSGGSNTRVGGTTASDRNLISGNASGIAIGVATSTQIQGNYIGTDVTGTVALGNGTGIYFYSAGFSDANNVVGGVVDGARNIISSNTNSGILFENGAQGNQVAGNYIGLDKNGNDLGNGGAGIQLASGATNNTIGGTSAEVRNVISGNSGAGILLQDSGTTGNQIQGNYIGTNTAGTGAIANTGNGVRIGGNGNIIGGSTAGAGNVISGNGDQGIAILSNTNTVRGNIIGLGANGTTALGNLDDGILIANGSNNTIGGTTAGDRNVIGSNSNNGISISGSSANNTVQGNYIGTAANGTTARGNGANGVSVGNGAANNSIGGTAVGASNLIANNSGDGVFVLDATTTGNAIQGNSISNNGDLGIDLGAGGVTANDTGDGDVGANGLQNFPVITAATLSGGNTLLAGTFNSTANTNFRLEFFSNPVADPSGNGEGQTFLGFVNVATNGSGNATFNPSFATAVPLGQFITATATNLTTNNTSEFAAARVVTGTPTVTLGLTGSPLAENGGAATVTATLSNASAQVVTVNLGFTGTATNVTDYTRSGTSILIPAGSLTGSVTLTGINDLLDEANETIIVDVTTVTNATESGTQQVTATITDDDPAPTVSISPASITQTEGNSGTKAYTYTVSLSSASGLPVTVNYTTNNGTATTANNDYVDNDGALVFNPGGALTQNITVLVNGDTAPEPTETFTVTLNSSTNGTLGTSTATGTITNDDVAALPTVSISPTTLALTEGNSGTKAFTFTVTLSAVSAVPVTVNYTTNNGTATFADNDYTDNDGALVFNPGDPLSKTITVLVKGDTKVEANETFTVTLNSAVNATLGTSTATGTINNDEARISLTNAISGGNGFLFNGIASGDFAGGAVSNAGDINGDGFDDLIISARRADPNSRADAGATYVVFGRASGFPTLSSLNGTNGFRIIGSKASDNLGGAVSSAGDINKDGYADLVIGARSADPASRRTDAGQAYVILGGRTESFANFSTVDLATLRKTGGFQNGFTISGEKQYDSLGSSVSNAGDVDGDTYGDFLVGAVTGDPSSGVDAGQAYLMFGGATSGLTDVDLTTLSSSRGLRINGVNAGDNLGYSVGAAGDINRDGRADFIVSATKADPGSSNAGQTYVVFGSSSLRTSGIPNLATLNGNNGFKINGVATEDNAGIVVKQAGDVNGDSFTDLVVTAPNADPNGSNSGAVYVIFGSASLGAGGTVNLSSLNGTNGFKLTGIAAGDFAGVSVAAAGDLNGDTFSDLIVGAHNADPGGSNSGETYVVYGGSTVGAGGTFNLSSINGSNGLVLTGVTANSFSGIAVAAGNFNGGTRDLLIGAPGAGAGSAYLVFGSLFG